MSSFVDENAVDGQESTINQEVQGLFPVGTVFPSLLPCDGRLK
jgi:hypothetical protein